MENKKKTFMERLKDGFTKEPQPMTNSNKYEVYKDLEKQRALDLSTIEERSRLLKNTTQDINEMTNAIRLITDELINDRNFDTYFLLQFQADYFCNTCRFETSNVYLKRIIINVIRGAFLMGCAGIYRNTTLNILEPVYITGLEYGIDGKLKRAKILPLSTCLQKMNETKSMVDEFSLKGLRTIEDCEENLAVFSWGTMGYSAWITKYPFVKLQHLFLTIIIINGFVFNKKWIYKINNFTNIRDELELFFNPSNPFIANVGNTEDLANRFATEEKGSVSGAGDVIDYYNKMVGVYYQLMGRKVNNDYKKERNISDEVEASQENYDVVQSDWLNQFDMFITTLQNWGLEVNVIENEEEEEDNVSESERNIGEQ